MQNRTTQQKTRLP